jgi:nucleotide-binding universal stress UspA family protein
MPKILLAVDGSPRARKAGCDMIHMGTRGMTTVENMLLGPVATKVLQISTIPVVLVH